MAQAPVLCDFDLALNNVDLGVARRVQVRTARHSSETMDRVWLRVLAYCWKWEERIAFGPGLGEPDTPDLLSTDLTGETTLWVRVGKADPAKIQRAADQNSGARIAVLFESQQRMDQFLAAAREQKLTRLGRVELAAVPAELLRELGSVDERRAKATVTLVGDHFYLERNGESLDGPIERSSL